MRTFDAVMNKRGIDRAIKIVQRRTMDRFTAVPTKEEYRSNTVTIQFGEDMEILDLLLQEKKRLK